MRKKKVEEHENHERWLVSYADFITLLFAFFVVLYATSTQNVEKEKKFEESVRASLKIAASFSDRGGGQGGGAIFGQVFDPFDMIQKRDIGNTELEDSLNRILKKSMTEQEQKETISKIRQDRDGVRISLAASTFFPSGSAKLRLPALKTLDKIAKILKLTNRPVVIEGHTDDQAVVGGNFESNWELASQRATSVVRYLEKYQDINPRFLSAVSYGSQRPLFSNDSEANRNKNRRIEILILNRPDEE